MNKLKKILSASLLVSLLFMGSAMAQGAKETAQPAPEQAAAAGEGCPMHADGAMMPVAPMGNLDFASQKACFDPQLGVCAVIDSIDNCVDVLMRIQNDEIDTVMLAFRYYADSMNVRHHQRALYDGKGRHDLPFVLRPVSVSLIAKRLVVLCSSERDSSYIAVLSLCPGHVDTVINDIPLKQTTLARVGFGCCAYGFAIDAERNELMVAGRNALGYDFVSLPLDKGLEGIAEGKMTRVHYHVPKQSDKIKASDPHGWGLACVAIGVVFLALCCIVFFIKIVSTSIAHFENKGKVVTPASDPDADVYAAIAAAIHLYNEEQHDEEPTIITIQKVERTWTPWNAKYISMNKYFTNRK
ncbi:MAG: OadG family protein [Bacteroidales bacterium]|nr:OadG family protein [Bacteroidales bacterium]